MTRGHVQRPPKAPRLHPLHPRFCSTKLSNYKTTSSHDVFTRGTRKSQELSQEPRLAILGLDEDRHAHIFTSTHRAFFALSLSPASSRASDSVKSENENRVPTAYPSRKYYQEKPSAALALHWYFRLGSSTSFVCLLSYSLIRSSVFGLRSSTYPLRLYR